MARRRKAAGAKGAKAQGQAIKRRWTDIDFPGAFSSYPYFVRGWKKKEAEEKTKTKKKKASASAQISAAEVKRALERDIDYQTARQVRKNFPRRRDVAYGFGRMEADLGDVGQRLPGGVARSGYRRRRLRFFLVLIDLFSRRLFMRGLANKSAKAVLQAFKSILEEEMEPPYGRVYSISSDMGKEFLNRELRDYLKSRGVQLIPTAAGNKAKYVERAIRSVKPVLLRYLEQASADVTWDEAVRKTAAALNRRYNRSIRMTPDEVAARWRELRATNLREREKIPYLEHLKRQAAFRAGERRLKEARGSRRSFKVGDLVVVAKKRGALGGKESDRAFGYQTYSIARIDTSAEPPMVSLVDGLGQPTRRKWYYLPEIRQVAEPSSYPVEKVLKTKKVGGRSYSLVRWLDHGQAFDTWLKSSEIKKRT